MIYIISGTVRSGTSMMAEMLLWGGKTLLHDPHVPSTDPTDDFPHNTLSLSGQRSMVNHLKEHDGVVVKMMATVLVTIPKDQRQYAKLIWMQRKPKCIVASLKHAAKMKCELTSNVPSPGVTGSIQKFWLKRVKTLGFDVYPLQYEKVVKNPTKEMKRLAKWMGPFNIEKAVNVVDPAKWRQR